MNSIPNIDVADLPAELRPIAEATILHAIDGTPLPSEIDQLIDWIEYSLDTYSIEPGDSQIAIDFPDALHENFSDDVLDRSESDGPITNEDRIFHARNEIDLATNDIDGTMGTPDFYRIKVTGREGRFAVVGLTGATEGNGFFYKVFGFFPSMEAFHADLKRCGFVFIFGFFGSIEEVISDKQILDAWQKPRKRKPRKALARGT